MKYRLAFSVLAGAFVVAISACGSSGGGLSTAPSSSPVVSASIVQSSTPGPAAFIALGCATPAQTPAQTAAPSFFIGSPRFDIIITTSQVVDMSHLTIALVDGTHVGGPSVTYPSPTLTSLFGSTRIGPGTRTFTVEPRFTCDGRTADRVGAHMEFVDMAGMTHTTDVSAPLH